MAENTFRPAFIIVLFILSLAFPARSLPGGAEPGPDWLLEYILHDDGAFEYGTSAEHAFPEAGKAYILRLASQEWRGIKWEHWLSVFIPDNLKYHDSAILIIEGGRTKPDPPSFEDERILFSVLVGSETGVPVAVLGQVPNQPLFGNLTEDALIAMTLDRFLKEGGRDWPLLFPMTKSAARAMDAIQEFLRVKGGNDVKKFILGGGSKRGWTSYLAAAADERVRGIIPVVIDMVNIPAQMQHQLKSYGRYSEMIADYSELNLPERIDSPEGMKLLSLFDPYSYLNKLTMPKLIILGTNDPYWTVDAANHYFGDLPDPAYLHYQPNTGHTLSIETMPVLFEFFHSVFSGVHLPRLEWSRGNDGSIDVWWYGEAHGAEIISARSENRDFREADWSREELDVSAGRLSVRPETPEEGYLAFYVHVYFSENTPGGGTAALSTEITVLPDTFPFTAEGRPIRRRNSF